jgi:hypothetical protein
LTTTDNAGSGGDDAEDIIDFLKDGLEHLRQIHFALVLVAATLIYIAYAATSQSPTLSVETARLRELLDALAGKSPNPHRLLNLVSQEWRDRRLSVFSGKIAQAIKIEPGLDFLSQLLVVVPSEKPFTWSKEESLDTLKARIDGYALRLRIPTAVGDMRYEPEEGEAIAESAPFSKHEIINRTAGNILAVSVADAGSKTITIDVWQPKLQTPNIRPEIDIRHKVMPDKLDTPLLLDLPDKRIGRIVLRYDDEEAQASLTPMFALRFPEIQKQWPKLAPKTLVEAEQYVKDQERETWRGLKAKIFDIEIEGERIALVGAIAINLILLYIAAYLETLWRYTTAFEDKIRQSRTFLPLWVGAQRGLFSRVIVGVSFIAAPVSLYFIFSRFSENATLTWSLIGLSAVLAILSLTFVGGVQARLPRH